MQTQIINSPVEVQSRLSELGWDQIELVEVVYAMVAGRNGCTANDPVSAPGWMAWKEGVRRIREIGATKGWRRTEIDQVPWTIDVESGVKFTVLNSNEAAGVKEQDPQNRNKRGAAAERAVQTNVDQLNLAFPDMPFDQGEAALPDRLLETVSWYLFVFCEGDTIRAELSCPVGIAGGFFTQFKERIFLSPDMFSPLGDDSLVPDAADEFDIPVERLPQT
ncbi:hypothetical protein [Lysobacter capsici]|uniref:hypothetical protein n=1 Tax=Lysobacter capsici TaxID=435897 RepID=UPI000627B930|nr:hypothetical protein [Lysobacter capsici]